MRSLERKHSNTEPTTITIVSGADAEQVRVDRRLKEVVAAEEEVGKIRLY
jgi:hypothetical protein